MSLPCRSGLYSRMAKGCKHATCLSITKLAHRLEQDGITRHGEGDGDSQTTVVREWVCTICLESFSLDSPALAHGRKHNHQIFFKDYLSGDFDFFCIKCGQDIELAGLNVKLRGVLEDSAVLIKEGLKNASSTKTVLADESSGTTTTTAETSVRPSGLVNLGNTCFLNSALQALASVALQNKELFNDEDVMCSLGPIGAALIGTIQSIPHTSGHVKTIELKKKKHNSKAGNIVDPGAFLGSISQKYKEFKRMRQQDSHDFLRLLFNALDDEHKETKLTPESRPIHKTLFGGKTCSRVVCSECKNATEVEESFMDLSLAIPSSSIDSLVRQLRSLSTEDMVASVSDELSLTDLLMFWARPARLSGDNAFACENCPKADEGSDAEFIYRPATLQFCMRQLPHCLIFHLQRFSMTSAGKRGVRFAKDHTHVSIPLVLNLEKYCEKREAPAEYQLTAMVIHEGSSVDSGHYVAVVRYGENDWWHISDTSARPVSSISGYNPYLVFYTKASAQ